MRKYHVMMERDIRSCSGVINKKQRHTFLQKKNIKTRISWKIRYASKESEAIQTKSKSSAEFAAVWLTSNKELPKLILANCMVQFLGREVSSLSYKFPKPNCPQNELSNPNNANPNSGLAASAPHDCLSSYNWKSYAHFLLLCEPKFWESSV